MSYTRYVIIIILDYIFDLLGFRFQIVVLSAYKQIRSQSDDILSDIDEDNYDRAFNYLRPGSPVSFYLHSAHC